MLSGPPHPFLLPSIPTFTRHVARQVTALEHAHPPTFPLPTCPCEAAYNWQQVAGDTRGRVAPISYSQIGTLRQSELLKLLLPEYLERTLHGHDQSVSGRSSVGGFCESFSARLHATRSA
jgi:hypothetical protein